MLAARHSFCTRVLCVCRAFSRVCRSGDMIPFDVLDCTQAGYKLENGAYSILNHYDYLPRATVVHCRLENGVS